ncbi:hypothetical protein GCM10023166_09620 [Paeniglutamicibacter cryotolerans]
MISDSVKLAEETITVPLSVPDAGAGAAVGLEQPDNINPVANTVAVPMRTGFNFTMDLVSYRRQTVEGPGGP